MNLELLFFNLLNGRYFLSSKGVLASGEFFYWMIDYFSCWLTSVT